MTETLTREQQAPQRAAGRIAVCVSGQGSNLRALHRAAARRAAERPGWPALGADIVLVLADRDCPALEFAVAQGLPVATVRPADHPDQSGWDEAVASALRRARPDLVVLAGFMRRLGRAVLDAFPRRILNVHPSLLPAFPGRHAVTDALDAGVKVTGVTVHIVDETLDGGPIVVQEAVPVLPADDPGTLAERLHAVEHRLLPRAVALALADALKPDGRVITIDPARVAALPVPRRALLSVSDKSGLDELARALTEIGFELVSTGGTARALRSAGLEVTDVAGVTGSPEMLDGRVKTLHPRIEGGVLADLRRADHRAQLAEAWIEPFELVVVNLYPFAEAAARPHVSVDELVEEIDIGGPTLVRAAAKNHASVAILTRPHDYAGVMRELAEEGRVSDATRRRLAAEAFRQTAEYDARIAAVLPARLGVLAAGGGDAVRHVPAPHDPVQDPFPPRLDLRLELVQRLRYGENPHQRAALYRFLTASAGSGPFAHGVELLQGKELSYNNLLDAAAAAALARDLRGAACVVVKHTNPSGAAEGPDPLGAWEKALAGDPVSAFGGVVAVTRGIDAPLAQRLTSIFLEVVVAPAVQAEAREILGTRANLRVLVDSRLGQPAESSIDYRTAGGALLATESDILPDDAARWRTVTRREPTERERADLDLAWRVVRHVKSNAIVLARDGAVVGVGAGQMSRVDSARLAVGKAGPERAAGAVCASDAFYPFADGVVACTDAGVTAFVQPGGSQRDGEVVAAADAAGAAMVFTGTRHFRH